MKNLRDLMLINIIKQKILKIVVIEIGNKFKSFFLIN